MSKSPRKSAENPRVILDARDVVVEYPSKGFRRPPFRALKSVSLDIRPGETVGLVGESGSGKTTFGRAILGLAPVASGSIKYDNQELVGMAKADRRRLAGEIQVVFQDPYTSLNPAMAIAEILTEPLIAQGTSNAQASVEVARLLDQVGLPSDSGERLPREFSGGQRQRVAIARALALKPRLIVCDEPVSALDLSTQARVLDLLVEIQERTGVAYLFVSHDLAVVRHISHRVAVMYHGEIVEYGDCAPITENPEHPYTRRLLMAAPVPDPAAQRKRRLERQLLVEAGALSA
ncbi:ATP-binding cassette domain-containing protein [Pseudarthrobacter psychrotolerans]|uniref:ATP-binding cassette domain-containing protein n=1 Tax=Pseudarthrobacter psychrotolerans TaxID=2697569 RepID=A0A6P1NH55_9MICC|nr:ATP-binding cassette domain-containing protein [Pseudarthrobacter psychrotolerans]QHK18493.1 ATP-binding cassette domain-containing protein [Pseudarthrobacter psychrotolerans]